MKKGLFKTFIALLFGFTFLGSIGLSSIDTDNISEETTSVSSLSTLGHSSEVRRSSSNNIVTTAIGSSGNCDGNHTNYQSLTSSSGTTLTDNIYVLDEDIQANLTISGNVTLCLNGNVLKGTGSGSVITVQANANFTLVDCNTTSKHYFYEYEPDSSVTNGDTTWNYYTRYIYCGDTDSCSNSHTVYHYATTTNNHVEITGGVITGGNSREGGGVYVSSGATFTMEGGNISGNYSSNDAGGVYVTNATFIMNDGEISGNYAKYGGGILLINGANFTMNEGSILNNTATEYDGAVRIYQSEMTMNGGTISGNASRNDGGAMGLRQTGNEGSTLTINNGLIYNNYDAHSSHLPVSENSTLNINGGYLDFVVSRGSGKDVNITAGSFSESLYNTIYTQYVEGSSDYTIIKTKYYTDFPYTLVALEDHTHTDNTVFPKENMIDCMENSGELTGGNYRLVANVTLDNNLVIKGDVTLCLNGYILAGNGNGAVITIKENASLTICDCREGSVTNTLNGVQYDSGIVSGGTDSGVYSSGTFVF